MAKLNYKHLRYFWAVAHEESLTRAAQKLGVSQSALSVQIQKLEGALGHALFERKGRQLVLTEPGRITLAHADGIFAAGEELVSTLQERGEGEAKVLRIGASATLSRNFQLQFLQPVLGAPNVRIVLRSGEMAVLMHDLRGHRLDVVLSNGALEGEDAAGAVCHKVAEQAVSLIGGPSFAGETTLKDALATLPLVLPTHTSAIRQGFDALAAELKVAVRVASEIDDMAMMRLLVREGAGVGVMPPIVVRDELANGVLSEIAALPSVRETFYAVTVPRLFPNPMARDLIGHALRDGGLTQRK